MPDPITRLNAALEGRYRVERELGEGQEMLGRASITLTHLLARASVDAEESSAKMDVLFGMPVENRSFHERLGVLTLKT